jgi:hypothetical protein
MTKERAEKMRKFGWGGTLVVMGLALAAAAVPADAGGYVLSLNGPATVDRGEQFHVDAVLSGPPIIDSMIMTIGVAGPRSLIYNGYQLGGNVQFQTGGPDDFSRPKGATDTGLLALNPLLTNDLYPLTPSRADAYFDATTRPGSTFNQGTIVSMTLTMPTDAVLNETFDFTVFHDTLGFEGATFFEPIVGGPLRVMVVPEPVTLALLGLGGIFAARRRLLGA